MSNGIFLIPPVPESIKDAINQGNLAVFIGAGVSRLVGCLGWDELARKLIERCYGEGIINFKDKETLSQERDHKKTITICYHLFDDGDNADLFFEEMSKALKGRCSREDLDFCEDIHKLRGLFITTNADTHFDRPFRESNILFKLEDFEAESIDVTNLYHIHGSIRDTGSLVFTVSQYMRRYNEPVFRTFLERIFRKYVVLFLGYGVSEFEILDFILRDNPHTGNEEPRHHILKPFYKSEENVLEYERAYYRDLDINVHAYEMDNNGYDQLKNVVSKWEKEINQVTNYQNKTLRAIEEALE